MGENGVNTLISTGEGSTKPNFNAVFEGVSRDGTRVFFSSDEALVEGVEPPKQKYDNPPHIYEREDGSTRLVATLRAGEGASQMPHAAGISDDGARVFFETAGALVPQDRDHGRTDVYEYAEGVTRLVSVGARRSNVRQSAEFAGASADGRRVFFGTRARLVRADRDSAVDIYERSGDSTRLVSTAARGARGGTSVYLLPRWRQLLGWWPFGHPFLNSLDGRRIFFSTRGSFAPQDRNPFQDIYGHFRGRTRLVSGSPGGFPWVKPRWGPCCLLV
jgi:hypothetical protein